jgi:MFS family permease
LAYHIILRIGADVRNPLTLYAGQDRDEANFILNCVFSALAVSFAFVSDVWSLYLRRVTLLPIIEKIMTSFYRSKKQKKVASWFHIMITLVAALASCVGQILYSYFMGPGNELLAWLLGLLVPLPVWFLYGIYAWWWGDSIVFGPDEEYILSNGGLQNEKSAEVLKLRRDNILKAVLPMAFFQFFGTLIMGGVRFTWDDIDVQWPVAIGVLAGLVFILLLLMIVMYMRRRRERGNTCDDDGDYYSR